MRTHNTIRLSPDMCVDVDHIMSIDDRGDGGSHLTLCHDVEFHVHETLDEVMTLIKDLEDRWPMEHEARMASLREARLSRIQEEQAP